MCLFELSSNGRFNNGGLEKKGSLEKGSFLLFEEGLIKDFKISIYGLSKVFNSF